MERIQTPPNYPSSLTGSPDADGTVVDNQRRTEQQRQIVQLSDVRGDSREGSRRQPSEFNAPPEPKVSFSSLQQTEEALNRVVKQLMTAGRSPTDEPATNTASVTLSQLESMSMEDIMRVSSLLVMSASANAADLKGKSLEIRTDAQEKLRAQEVKKVQEQVDKAIEDAQKAKKAGIFSAVLDWVIGVAEVVSGAFKLAGGILSGNPLAIAGGVADLGAGFAGLGKAFFETMALVDPDNAEKYNKIADVFGKVQLACEVVGMAIDVFNLARGLRAAGAIGNATKTVMEGAGGEALKEAVKTGSKEAVEGVAKSIGKEVADNVAAEVMKKLTEEIGKSMAPEALGRLTKSFSQEAIETLVAQSVKTVATKAMEQGAEQVAKLTAKELSEQVVKQVNRQVAQAVLKASVTVVGVVRATAGSVKTLGSGAINKERAALQQEIQKLIAEQQWLQMLYQLYEDTKKDSQEQLKALTDQGSQAASSLSDASNTTNQLLINNITSANV